MTTRYYISCFQHPAFVVTDAMKWKHKAEPKVLDTYGEAVKVAEKMDGIGFWPVVQVVRGKALAVVELAREKFDTEAAPPQKEMEE